MAAERLPQQTPIPQNQIAEDLLIHVVDPNDTTQHASGSSFKVTLGELKPILATEQCNFSNITSDYTSNPIKAPLSGQVNFVIKGYLFDESMVVQVAGQTVDVVFVDSLDTIFCQVTAGSVPGLYDITVSSDCNTIVIQEGFEVLESDWVDLRLGGTPLTTGNAPGNDIRHHPDIVVSRDADGMKFQNAMQHKHWVKAERDIWQRGQGKTLEMIVKMPPSEGIEGLGIAAADGDELASFQYDNADPCARMASLDFFYGLVGNQGTLGQFAEQADGEYFQDTRNEHLKFVFRNDAIVGSVFNIYLLPSGSPTDWDDYSNALITRVVGDPPGQLLNPQQLNICPFWIRFQTNPDIRSVAYKVY